MLATLIASVLSGEATEALGRVRRKIVAYLIAGLLAACGVGFFIGAGTIALAREVGAVSAALWIGGAFVLTAVLVLIVHRIMTRVRARRVARRRETEAKAVGSAAALAMLPALFAGKGSKASLAVSAAVAAGALGYAFYRSMSRRGRDDYDD